MITASRFSNVINIEPSVEKNVSKTILPEPEPILDLLEDPMNVSKKHLQLMLTKVLTVPRNHEHDKVGIIAQFLGVCHE